MQLSLSNGQLRLASGQTRRAVPSLKQVSTHGSSFCACRRQQALQQLVPKAGPNGRSPAPTASKPAKKPAPNPSETPFTNTNRFIVPKSCRSAFEAEWRQREKDMEKFAGFVDFRLVSDGENFIISSSWASIPDWEAWSLSPVCRRSHLPWGIWQHVPKKGEGFPEDFVPFIGYDEPVNAKYF